MTGLGVDKILRRAGHESIATTLGYVKRAKDLGGELGEPFAPLPAALLGETDRAKDWAKPATSSTAAWKFQAESRRRGRDS